MVNLFSLIKDYLVDKEDGIRQLITWFLNVVMEEEALLQAGAQRYEGRIHVKPVETATNHGLFLLRTYPESFISLDFGNESFSLFLFVVQCMNFFCYCI